MLFPSKDILMKIGEILKENRSINQEDLDKIIERSLHE